MKLLVTGGLGFIGSNFILKMLDDNSDMEILNIDAELDGANRKNLNDLENSKNYEFVKGNISNKKFMEEQIDQSQLSWEEYFQFKIFQSSCGPLNLSLSYISNSEEDLEDQTKTLAVLYHACTEGTLSLAEMYRLHL